MKKRKIDYKDRLVKVDIMDVLLDENNTDPIVIKGKDGSIAEFEQMAVIPYEGDLYAILSPITKLEGMGSSDGVVVKVVKEENGRSGLEIADSCEATDAVFKEYYKMLYAEGPEWKETLNSFAQDLLKEGEYDKAKMVYAVLAEEGDKDAESSLEALEILIKEKEKNN